MTVPEPYVTGKCYACRRPPLPRKGCRSIPVDSTVNIQSTSVNIQSTYSQHTVNIKAFSAENFGFLYISGHGATLSKHISLIEII